MSSRPLQPGDVYWIYDAEADIDHLHVILTHPEPIDGEMKVAVVNISSVKGKIYDRTTVLEPGSHERVKRQSYVRYRDADFERVADIENKKGYAKATEPLRTALFKEIYQKVITGKTPAGVQQYCSKRVGLNPGDVLDLKGG